MLALPRCACLGSWTYGSIFGLTFHYLNQQKVRVDLFLEYISKKNNPPSLDHIKPKLARNDMDNLFQQQVDLPWLKNKDKIDFIVMDSYSELVDQKFTHKDGWSFCACYSDIKDMTDLTCEGLIKTDNLYYAYDDFFDYLKINYNVPINFIHFPTTFEKRQVYINQGEAIKEAIHRLCGKYDINNIIADPEYIEQKDHETYHFSDKTVKHLSNKLKY